ncbi:bifunctional sulfate adenylyltransferase subunit 1/adenylylsulfate kinase [Bremerella cremea]|uniref:sulfate adenylyltransferase n=1 Tax=Bremerella cremea TaxID=1031537 RepID=A0A368KSP6_9BACT|nr:GTP-binding protein [Bremerella cremea]RCS49132.1 bifunctional sulfate adenylyltransferase subunit 1/adenylylsulfate kinase [Bremerella cremea]
MFTHPTSTTDIDLQHEHPPFGILRLLTCGSVDDGKSTLIGRLLLETGAVYEDHLQSLQLETKRHGTTELLIDPALLVDGLEDERAQGITIDVAYRYVRSPRRKVIIADSPGHEQYTRNMVTAASRSDVALILVDARKGIVQQTKRHAIIASLLGIKRFILAVNKMDLIDEKQRVYDAIARSFREFAQSLGELETTAIPLSGLCGDNVCRRSLQMPWYEGPTLLEALESSPDSQCVQKDLFKFPIQRVVRPNSEFRGVSGTILSGSIRVNDPIIVLPQGTRSTVRSIVTMEGELSSANGGQAVTITLEDEIDLARGDWIVSLDSESHVSQNVYAKLVWMARDELELGRTYFLRCVTKKTMAEVESVESVIDIETGSDKQATTLRLNEIGRCRVLLHEPIVHDHYNAARDTGAFILVDKISHETVAAGIILPPEEAREGTGRSNDGRVHSGSSVSKIPVGSQAARLEHDSVTVLVSGDDRQKHVDIAQKLSSELYEAGFHVVVVDEALIGEGIADAFGISSLEGRKRLVRNLQIAHVLNQFGIISLVPVEMADLRMNENALPMLECEKYMIVETKSSDSWSASPIERNLSTEEEPRSSNAEKESSPIRVLPAYSDGAESIHHLIDAIVTRVRK